MPGKNKIGVYLIRVLNLRNAHCFIIHAITFLVFERSLGGSSHTGFWDTERDVEISPSSRGAWSGGGVGRREGVARLQFQPRSMGAQSRVPDPAWRGHW